MTKYEKFGLNAVARLVDPITNSATTLIVTTVDRFPTDGNFRITLGREIMLVTAISGTTFTIVRGYESSTALAHDAGVPVQQTITTGALERAMLDSVPLARDSARPQLNTLVDSSGNTLTLSDFTWVNQGTALASDLNSGGISLTSLGSGSAPNLRILTRSAPTPPYIITAGFVPQLHTLDNCSVGMGFRRVSNGYTTQLLTGIRDRVAVLEYSSPTSFNATLFLDDWFMGRNMQWLQIEDDNTDLFYRTSMDGINWQQIHTHARAARHNLTVPDQVFFYADALHATVSVSMALIAWEES